MSHCFPKFSTLIDSSSRHITHYAHVINMYIIHHMGLMVSRMTTQYTYNLSIHVTQSRSFQHSHTHSHAALQYNCQPCVK
jgi:hypothetical protein